MISLKNRLIFVEVKARLRYIEVAKTIKCPVLPNKPPFGIIDARKRFRFSRAKLLERRTVMISIRDIAKECGVSVATVSKALNGHHDISAQTRETVCRKAAEMGYQPNSAARALKTNRTYNLGVLYEDPQHSGLGHEYFSRILESFRAQAEACGYDVTFINRNVGKRRSSYLEHCRYRGVDGVCVVCVNFLDPQVLELVQSELPVVTVDHMFNNRTSIVSDNVKGVQTLVNHVFGMGHRNIAFIHGERTAVTESRCASFYKTCYDLGLHTVAMYSNEDINSLFRIKADEAYLIGENQSPLGAYLDIPGIIDLARRRGVDAIHPGYGFLSENAEFAKACEEAGADGICLINTLLGMRVDTKKRAAVIANKMGGFSGDAIFPVAVRMVYQVSKACNIPVMGCGGVSSASDVIEMMMAGATAVQVGAANLVDPYACKKIIEQLPIECEKLGITKLSDIIGVVE